MKVEKIGSFFDFLRLKRKEQNEKFSLENSYTSRNFSIEALMEEFKLGKTEKNSDLKLEYRGGSSLIEPFRISRLSKVSVNVLSNLLLIPILLHTCEVLFWDLKKFRPVITDKLLFDYRKLSTLLSFFWNNFSFFRQE